MVLYCPFPLNNIIYCVSPIYPKVFPEDVLYNDPRVYRLLTLLATSEYQVVSNRLFLRYTFKMHS